MPPSSRFKLMRPMGALVSDVLPGSAGALAGLMPGDVILHADGKVINSAGDLPAVVTMAAPGAAAEPGRVAGRARAPDGGGLG